MDPAKFKNDFIFCLKRFMIVFKREQAVERALDFITKFACSLNSVKNKENLPTATADDDDDMHPFLLDLFNFLLQSHDVRSKAVRFRVCQLINKLLIDLGDNANIDDVLYQQIYDSMLTRLSDICPVVRTHAVLALKRLQDPENDACPIIEAFLTLMSQDKNHEVRKAVLSSIAVCMKTLEPILKRTRDVNHQVRRMAFKIITENVNVKILTIAQRVSLIRKGLKDNNDQIRDVCTNIMIQSWYRMMDQDIFKLLSVLFCQNYVDECSELLLKVFFDKKTAQQLVDEFTLLDERHCIPLDKMTCENVLYWQVLCQHIRSMGAKEEVNLDRLMPTCIGFVKYFKEILANMKRGNAVTDEEIVMQKKEEFMLYQVAIIMGYLDVSDQAGRSALSEVIKSTLIDPSIPNKVLEQLIKQFVNLYSDMNQLVAKMSEVVSDILQMSYNKDGGMEMEQTMEVDAEKMKKLEMELAKVSVELMHLQDVLEERVKNQDFVGAAEVKETINKLKGDKVRLTDEMSVSGNQGKDLNIMNEDEDETERSLLSQATTDPIKMKRCLMIVAEILKYTKVNKIVPSLLTILDNLVIPGVVSVNSEVRDMGVKVLGLCCLRDVTKAQQYCPLLFQVLAVDRESVKLTALKAIFDMLLFWGLPAINEKPKDGDIEEDKEDDVYNVTKLFDENAQSSGDGKTNSNIVEGLLKYLDSEVEEIRTTCSVAFARLLYSNRIISPSLISRLLLIWYNPMTEDDTKLRVELASFFINYSLKSNPLYQVKPSNVAELFVNLSHPQNMKQNNQHEEILYDKTPHDDMAISLCNEILSNPHDTKKVLVYSRTLMLLSVSPSNRDVLKSLRVLAKKIIKLVEDRTSKIAMIKFSKSIKKMLMSLDDIDADLSQLDETLIDVDSAGLENDVMSFYTSISEATSAPVDSQASAVSEAISNSTATSNGRNTTTSKRSKSSKAAKNLPNVQGKDLSSKDAEIEEENSSDDFTPPAKRIGLARNAKQSGKAKVLVKTVHKAPKLPATHQIMNELFKGLKESSGTREIWKASFASKKSSKAALYAHDLCDNIL
ncbi:hypothetical protein HELRODRAFT_161124 [Helobdella robusta]|uniref:Nuclear condensin complex subunit 3 C-terminal domain-containing protein n=1 Tax=Helobdella robusta TaxID=6412 RepID=T1ER42_HELRO|nr:hypothetical protein HELRODRAFT_161124 [Helobdella robusta]ESO01922.1 hypothetical protein HELRODRAFT_161124 [Helobdella robusta]